MYTGIFTSVPYFNLKKIFTRKELSNNNNIHLKSYLLIVIIFIYLFIKLLRVKIIFSLLSIRSYFVLVYLVCARKDKI